MDIGNVFIKLFLNYFCDIFGIIGVAVEKDVSDSYEWNNFLKFIEMGVENCLWIKVIIVE